MSGGGDAVRQAGAAQADGSHPEASAWVDASAGSGKTKVLSDRALRLMLAYNAPERILCLTFTKAAAAEMSNRIVGALAGWASAPPDALRTALEELTGGPVGDGMLARARGLFAAVVDAPGGLKVQTVHAFCQSALERFPVEAGAPPGFAALDERAAADLMIEARDFTLRAAMAADPATPLARALDRMALRGGADALDAVLQSLLSERARLATHRKSRADEDWAAGAAAAVVDALDFADEAAAEAAVSGPVALLEGTQADLARLAEGWAAGGATDKKKAAKLTAWLEAGPAARRETLTDCLEVFFTSGGAGSPFKAAASKSVLAASPWFADLHAELITFAVRLRDDAFRGTAALDTVAAIRLAADVDRRYGRMKQTRAALDFDDLILKTRDLLESDGGAAWALYKLDQGVDHILVDEAQDTNPDQWRIVHALAGEFFQTAGDTPRTIFAVGDPKQSIFSFQRADPQEFQRSKDAFGQAAHAIGQPFHVVGLPVSFRSAPAVLAAVDAVFASEEASAGLAPDGRPPVHLAARAGLPGRVELWPLAEPVQAEPGDLWTPLLDYPDQTAKGPEILAARIAEKIKALIADPDARVGFTPERPQGRRIEPGDVMVVVQRRAPFADALARALKARDVPTAGVDRMRLPRQLAVRDLMALGQAASLPEDDLAVACLLKSPLCGIDEEGLFQLAYGRGRLPLWIALKLAAANAEASAEIKAAWALLEEAMARADFLAPFDFFQWALGPKQGRARMAANMGAAVTDVIDEFLALALRYASERPASLTGFLAWVDRDQAEAKRELEGAAAGVRLLTAHSAKGLEAPVVFLPDVMRSREARPRRLFWKGATPILGAARQAEDCALVRDLADERRLADQAERRRLLYVAMTRAEDRLYVAGWAAASRAETAAGTWRAYVEAGFARLQADPVYGEMIAEVRDSDGLATMVLNDPGTYADREDEPDQSVKDGCQARRPSAWLNRPAPPRPSLGPVRAPSRAVVEDADAPPATLSPLARVSGQAAAARRFGRGLLIHKLLERLPTLKPADRPRLASAFFARDGGVPPAERAALTARVLALFDDPRFGVVFAPDTLAEAPIAGEIGGRRFAGVIDRLALTSDRALIVDFKTNRPPPAGPEATPRAYLEQMALYRALARQAFPERAVEAAILWTEAPRLDPLADSLLDPFAPDA